MPKLKITNEVKKLNRFGFGKTFLAATSSSRSDDVTLSVCLLACLFVTLFSSCQLCTFAPLHFAPLNLCNVHSAMCAMCIVQCA